MSKRSTNPPLQYAISPTEWKPHAYQRKAVKFLLEHAGAALFLDPGLGKTSISLAAQSILKKEGVSGKTLVIAPLRVCLSVWPNESEKWKNFGHLRVAVLHGKGKEERLWDGDADIYCINPEGLEWLFGVTKTRGRDGKVKVHVDVKRVARLFDELGFTDLIVDESTKFKSSASQRFKILKLVLRYFIRRWILTGTPAPNGLLDLFGQIFIVDMGRTLGEYITHYRKKFFDPVGFGGFSYRPKPGAELAIYKALKKLVLRLDAKDYLELPEVIVNPIRFDLPEDARKLYDELEDEMVSEFGENKITALNAASAMSKCAQVANGGLYEQKDPLIAEKRTRGVSKWMEIHNYKTDIAVELVDELNGQPVMIAYEFVHDLERLREAFGKEIPYIGGGVSAASGKAIEQQWNAGRIPVLPVQPASAAHGLNLQGASDAEVGHLIFYGMTYDYELYEQLIRRIARQGSKHKRVIVHLILARDTVDEAKYFAIRSKEKGQNKLLDALRTYVRARQAARSQARSTRKPAPVSRSVRAAPVAALGAAGRGRAGRKPAPRPAKGRKP